MLFLEYHSLLTVSLSSPFKMWVILYKANLPLELSGHTELAFELQTNGYQLLSFVFLISRVVWIKKVKVVPDEKKLLTHLEKLMN